MVESSSSPNHGPVRREQNHEETLYLFRTSEIDLIKKRIKEIQEQIDQNAHDMQAAVEQSSESWHDNAPHDVVRLEYSLLLGQRVGLEHLLRHSVVVPDPKPDFDQVAIGSRVSLRTEHGTEFALDIVGYDALGRTNEDPDIDITTYKSPIATLIMGCIVGDICAGEINGREIAFEIVNIDQSAQLLSHLEKPPE